MKNIFICFILTVLAFTASFAQEKLTSFVDPFIGTGGHGHTFPGAVVPFGMVQLSPDNGRDGNDWVSGYNYKDNKIAGFSHMHLSGTDIGDWLDISVMPLSFPLRGQDTIFKAATFSHSNEQAAPGYYAVKLDNGIQAELTTTERVGYHRYTFPAGTEPTIRFDLGFYQNLDIPTETFIKKVNDSTLVGYRYSTGMLNMQRVYFAAKTSKPFSEFHLKGEMDIEVGNISIGLESTEKGKGVSSQLIFLTTNMPETIELKVALSMTDIDKALLALNEIPNWNFNEVKVQADSKWEKELNKINVRTPDVRLKRIFYTALYHTAIMPALYSDADGGYGDLNGEAQVVANGGSRYTQFPLWNSFKVINPLFAIIQPDRYNDLANSMLSFHEENQQSLFLAEANNSQSNSVIERVPQDTREIKNSVGLEKQLDLFFDKGSESWNNQHAPFLYSYLGKPWKTQALIRQILNTMYDDKPDGYKGDKGSGQMSAWAVWNIIGFYPVSPTNGEYMIGSPIVDATSIQLKDNKKFEIEVLNNNSQNKYIQSVKLNGATYKKSYLLHKDIVRGGKLTVNMGPEPNSDWGQDEARLPSLQSNASEVIENDAESEKKNFFKNISKSISDFFNNLFK